MPVTKIGIYLAYPPTVDLRAQGLGRYLAFLLKASSSRSDIRICVACPSWSRESLLELCEAENIDSSSFDVIAPTTKPAILKVFNLFKRRRRSRAGFFRWFAKRIWGYVIAHRDWLERKVATARSAAGLLIVGLYFSLLLVVLAPVLTIVLIGWGAATLCNKTYQKARLWPALRKIFRRASHIFDNAKNDTFVLRLYDHLKRSEMLAMKGLIDRDDSISAWISPTAFWPEVSELTKPTIVCVPDVVLTDFALGFGAMDGRRFEQTYRDVMKTIRSGKNFVTYSEHVKWATLVRSHGVRPEQITVIPHAANNLRSFISSGENDKIEPAASAFCARLVLQAIRRSRNHNYAGTFSNEDLKFIFFPTQFRPNKNIINLVRSYDYLLRRAKISHKLVLTGNQAQFAQVAEEISNRSLDRDVIFVESLTVTELAAFYHRADLAVNSSISEGGCPFTFTEALSVGTPVVMSRIPVTLELLGDAPLAEVSFFDPYDWQDMAARIEWALSNLSSLLELQMRYFDLIAERKWTNVLDEYVSAAEAAALQPRDGAR